MELKTQVSDIARPPLERSLRAIGEMAVVLGTEPPISDQGNLLPGGFDQLMQKWTGTEPQNTGLEVTTDRYDNLLDSWSALRQLAPIPELGHPTENSNFLLVLGASGDIMADHAERIEGWKEDFDYRPNQIWYLAGMRAAGTTGDRHFSQRFGIDVADWSETDMARYIIRYVHGGVLQRSTFESSSVVEREGSLGRRAFSHEYYLTPDGREIVLLNGAAVDREGGGRPRHTSRSVFQEFFDTSIVAQGNSVHLLATYPYAERVALEFHLKNLERDKGERIDLQTFGVMPPVDRLSPEALLSTLLPLYRVSSEILALDNLQQRTKLLRATENVDVSAYHAAMSTVRQRAINALLWLTPPGSKVDIESTAKRSSLEAYLTAYLGPLTERRSDALAPLFENASARGDWVRLLKELGVNTAVDIGPEKLDIEGPWAFIGEGGTGPKMFKQLEMLKSSEMYPEVVVLAATDERAIPEADDPASERQATATILELPMQEVGETEYKVAEQLARKFLVARPADQDLPLRYDIEGGQLTPLTDGVAGDFRLIGYTEAGKPIVLMNVRRQYGEESGVYKALGVTGTYRAVAELLKSEQFRTHIPNTAVDTICFASSTLYAPTRTLDLLASRKSFGANQELQDMKLCLALYRRVQQADGGIDMAQAASELHQLLIRVLTYEADTKAM